MQTMTSAKIRLLETVLKVHVRDENPRLMNLMNLLSYIHV